MIAPGTQWPGQAVHVYRPCTRRETPVARATRETPPYPIASLSAAATNRLILSSKNGESERNRCWMSAALTTTSIKQNQRNLFQLFSDRP
jgi:hypothetical protein